MAGGCNQGFVNLPSYTEEMAGSHATSLGVGRW